MAAFTKISLLFCTLLVLCLAASVYSQARGQGIEFCLECGNDTNTPFNATTVSRCVVFQRNDKKINQSIFQCLCREGFKGNGITCNDKDECLDRIDNNCDNNADCTNTVGSYECTCQKGYNGTGIVCDEIDECEEAKSRNINLCDGGGTCTNIPGSYKCSCQSGYEPINNATNCGDVNECDSTIPPCGTANCTNTAGSFTCSCPFGYYFNGTSCINVRDCSANFDVCDRHGVCANISGAWMCECKTGYAGNGVNCYDVDECLIIPDADKTLCGGKGRCQNKDGSYTCVCDPGFQLNTEGTDCIDIDECAEKSHDCSMYSNTQCLNVYGGAECVCKPGWTGSFTSCKNINECDATIPPCGAARCTDTAGSFTCSCSSGYELNGTRCVDINECERYNHICDRNANCTNTEGSWQCACRTGYTGTGIKCTDIDECSAGSDVCDMNADCKNTEGSWVCACKTGYVGDGITCYDPKPPVPNFNVFKGVEHCVRCGRLSATNVPYYQISKCALTTLNYEDFSQSEYRCECLAGFTGDGLQCEDINECQDGGHRCHPNAICTNTKGGYSCQCEDRYKGDGFACTSKLPLSDIIGK